MGSPHLEPDSVPTITWVILVAAVFVFAAAGFVGLREPGTKSTPHGASKNTSEKKEDGREASEPSPSEPSSVLPPNPISITAELLDAESRSHLWNPDATLSSIQTVLSAGGGKTPIEFEFGVPKLGKLPGSSLGSERLAVLYSKGRAVQTPRAGKSTSLSASPPNCPLEVAVRKTPLGELKDSVAVLYSYSKKHGRPIWHFTDNTGQVHRIDGNSCAVLLH